MKFDPSGSMVNRKAICRIRCRLLQLKKTIFKARQQPVKPLKPFPCLLVKPQTHQMIFIQQNLQLRPYPRGFHLITNDVLQSIPEVSGLKKGMLQVFIQHTSASLTINENADPSVRDDFEMFFNKAVPENDPDYVHTDEGPDDMPAHLKAALLGSSVLIPVRNGRPALGIWQGIYLCEHRDHGGPRKLVITAWGE